MTRKEIKVFNIKADGYGEWESTVPVSLAAGIFAGSEARGSFTDNIPENCELSASIELSQADVSKKHIYVKLEGVVAKGEVYLNGKSLGLVSNANRTYVFDVADRVYAGENTLLLKCFGPIGKTEYINADGLPENEYDTDNGVYDIGLNGYCELLIGDGALIKNVSVREEHEEGKVTLFVKPDILGASDDVRAVASLVSPSGKIYFGGASENGITITVSDPELWWPNGYGTQGLYRLSVTLYCDGEAQDTYERSIGLRTVEYLSGTDGIERFFVNGIEIFPMGGVYLFDISGRLAGYTKMEETLSLIKAANVNTVIAYDMGIAPPERFFTLCDKMGILVILPVSLPYCAPHNLQGAFTAGIGDAVKDVLNRFGAHTSALCAYLAVTENEECSGAEALNEYCATVTKMLNPVLSNREDELIIFNNKNDLISRDERERSCKRFSKTGKINSLPDEKTMKAFLPGGGYNLFSEHAESFVKNEDEHSEMLARALRQMPYPIGMRELAYAVSVTSANTLSRSIRYERCEDDGCTSAILRQLNEMSFGFSSSVIDCNISKKATYYALRSAFAPVVVNVTPCEDFVTLTVRNDSKKIYNGNIRVAIWNMSGRCMEESSYPVTVYPSESVRVSESNLEKYLSSPKEYYVYYELFTDKSITERGTHLLTEFKRLKLEKPNIKSEILGFGKKYTLKLTAPAPVFAAYVDFAGFDVKMKSNFVDILPESTTAIEFETDKVTTSIELASAMRIISAYDVGREVN